MVRGRETKILHSMNQRKGHATAHKREPEQKEQREAALATMNLTLEAMYTAEGTWAHFEKNGTQEDRPIFHPSDKHDGPGQRQ